MTGEANQDSKQGTKAWSPKAVLLAAVGAAAALGLAAVLLRGGKGSECELCLRPVHEPTAFSVEVGGREVWACCARCGLSIHREGEGRTARAVATDFPTGRRVPAESCVYVEGSDLAPCCSPETIVVGAKVACGKCFDRCYPSVIAFADPKEALAYAKEHGGTIVSFETLLRELKSP